MASTLTLGYMTRDGRGDTVELLSVRNWRATTAVLSAGQWTLLRDGSPASCLILKSAKTNPSDIILAQSNLSAISSNDPASALCGFPLSPGDSFPITFTENLAVYGRVVAGGSVSVIHKAEAL